MQSMKETASNIAASAKSGMDKTKATLEEKAEKMKTRDPVQKQMATQVKEDKINQAEMQKRETREYNAAMKEAAGAGTGLGLGTATHSTTGQVGHGTGTHQMSALPGHGTGQLTDRVVEGTAVTDPIGRNTGTGRTTAHNTLVGGGGTTGYGGPLFRQILEKDEDDEGAEMAMIDLHASQYFVNMEYNVFPPPLGSHDIHPDIDDPTRIATLKSRSQTPDTEPISFPLLPDQGITRKELDIIKLTAQFVAVFGMCFGQDLMESVFMKPELEPLFRFILSTDSRHDFYSQLTLGYARVLLCIEKLKEKGASTETVLEGYFNLLGRVLEREIEEGANPPPQMEPLTEEPEPTKQNLDEPTLVPEEQFLAQHPGSSTIMVSVPNFNDGKVIEITVQSLSGNVASLKEKVANKLKIRGKAGLLKEDKSLAHYNVGAGDILTLSL
ncbi:unnamed protein product [Arabidopsis arenosa]|uniref:SURP motif domain-containing protein n=1 Tax=Arabidopsis arenosa TaxID=38785 RepID=A0A8S2AI32_ARAAE|nr:unnamed protein product [Arabidopsis arenosa]